MKDLLFSTLKDYKKVIKIVEKDDLFTIRKSGRKNTLKILHSQSTEMLTIHPGGNAVSPLKKWLRKFNTIL